MKISGGFPICQFLFTTENGKTVYSNYGSQYESNHPKTRGVYGKIRRKNIEFSRKIYRLKVDMEQKRMDMLWDAGGKK